MSTVAELSVAEELAPLRDLANWLGWAFKELSPTEFLLGIVARDGSWFHLHVACDDYPALPPAWRWCNADGGQRDAPECTPVGSGFFHSNGVICAPWNRLAYNTVDTRGPHGDWTIGDWRNNSHTGGSKTLCSMALRLSVELNSPRYEKKRRG
jgi:hypothetical protein